VIMKCSSASLLSALVCVCCSCSPKSGPSPNVRGQHEEVIAVVGNERITAPEFQAEWNRRSRATPGVEPTLQQREQLLGEMIRTKAALAKARATGFDRKPETVALVNQLIATRYKETEFSKWSSSPTADDEKEIAEYYAAHQQRFFIPGAVRAGVITLQISTKADPDRRAALKAKATQILERVGRADAAEFRKLVQAYSDDQATRYTGGDTGWLTKNSTGPWDAAIAEAAFKLQTQGEVAPLVETARGFHIVRLIERRAEGVRPLAEVHEAVRYELLQAKRQERQREFFDELKRGLKIEINRTALDSIHTRGSDSDTPPPELPGG